MIYNLTRKKEISKQEIICSNWWGWARGLMFRPKQNLIMIFPAARKVSLHNFFVFYCLDVLIVSENKQILEIKERFHPFTFWNATFKAKYLIELAFPAKYEIGDKLVF